MSFVTRHEFSVRIKKDYFKDWCLMNSQPTFLFFNLFQLEELRPYYQKHVNQIISDESHNSLKHSFTNNRDLCSNFLDCGSFLESNSPDFLRLCENNLDDLIDSGNFAVRGYLLLIQKDSSTHMHGLRVYVKEGLPFAWDLFLENSPDSY